MSSIVLKLPENVDLGNMLRTDEVCVTMEELPATVLLNGISFDAGQPVKVGATDPPTSTLPKNVELGDVFRWIRPVYQRRLYLDLDGNPQWELNGRGPFDPTVQVKTLVEDDGTPA